MEIKAALIDMDGFLINSEELYLEANKIYFKKFNFTFTEELHKQGTGQKFEVWIKSVTNIDKTGEQILHERNEIYYRLAKERLKLLPGAKDFLHLMHRNFKTVLVTSSNKDYVDFVFGITEISRHFDLIITGELVTKGKPDPQCYLLAAKMLNLTPRECVVFEDAPNGILAGKASGMKVIAIPSPFVKGDKAFSKADLVLDSLENINIEKVMKD